MKSERKGKTMSEGAKGRRLLLAALSLTSFLTMTGCEALMPHADVDLTKTTGKSVYTGFDDMEENDNQIATDGGIVCDMSKVVYGLDNWETFNDKVAEGTPCSIRIKQKAGDAGTFYRDLHFDGSKYRLIISVDPEKYDYTFDYLHDVSGRKNKNCRQSRIIFLSNEKDASYEDIIASIGVNEDDRVLDYQLVFRNQ